MRCQSQQLDAPARRCAVWQFSSLARRVSLGGHLAKSTGRAHKYLHIFASLQIATNTPKAFNTTAPGRAAHLG
ncbi:MAG: hypothetical protein SGJ20_18920, partial [Planctomycetota bacterium]|nr:hypothetical protein [Planctomycetota bacterium]